MSSAGVFAPSPALYFFLSLTSVKSVARELKDFFSSVTPVQKRRQPFPWAGDSRTAGSSVLAPAHHAARGSALDAVRCRSAPAALPGERVNANAWVSPSGSFPPRRTAARERREAAWVRVKGGPSLPSTLQSAGDRRQGARRVLQRCTRLPRP